MCFWNDGAEECRRKKERRALAAVPISPRAAEALLVYQHSQTQWVYSGMGGIRTGFNYPGVAHVARALGIKWTRAHFLLLQRIEIARLTKDSAERKAEEARKKK